MAEVKTYTFDHKELAGILIKEQEVHEGFWAVYIEFGLSAANINLPSSDELVPAAIVPVKRIGIHRYDTPNNLTVDASVVNPRKKSKKP